MCSKSSNVCDLPPDNNSQKKPLDLDQNKNYYAVKSSSSASSSPASDLVSSPDTTLAKETANVESAVPFHQTQPMHHQPPEYHRPEPGFFGMTAAPTHSGNMSGLLPLDHYRLQLYNYAMVERIRNVTAAAAAQANSPYGNVPGSNPSVGSGQPAQHSMCPTYSPVVPYGPRLALSMSLFHNRVFQPEEPKPQHSYIGLIAMAILSTPDHKLVLSDIYQHILDNYPYFRTRGPGWRNSIRHNLSLNDCFIKAGRSANGKGHYWAIHPANLEDFKKGDFRRRKAQRKVRKHMGLAVDEDGADSPSPPPLSLTPPPLGVGPQVYHPLHHPMATNQWTTNVGPLNAVAIYSQSSRKRQFDVASLLAPDDDANFIKSHKRLTIISNSSPSPLSFLHQAATAPNPQVNNSSSDFEEDIDVVANDDAIESVIDRNSPVSATSMSMQATDNDSEATDDKDRYTNGSSSWNSLIQQFPMDPRILGRYYGQYMAAAQQRVASKKLITNLSTDQRRASVSPRSALPNNNSDN